MRSCLLAIMAVLFLSSGLYAQTGRMVVNPPPEKKPFRIFGKDKPDIYGILNSTGDIDRLYVVENWKNHFKIELAPSSPSKELYVVYGRKHYRLGTFTISFAPAGAKAKWTPPSKLAVPEEVDVPYLDGKAIHIFLDEAAAKEAADRGGW